MCVLAGAEHARQAPGELAPTETLAEDDLSKAHWPADQEAGLYFDDLHSSVQDGSSCGRGA